MQEQQVETYHPNILFTKQFRPILIACVTAFIFGIFYISFWSAPKNFPVGSIYDLKSGQTLSVVSNNFSELHIIRSDFWFKSFSISL